MKVIENGSKNIGFIFGIDCRFSFEEVKTELLNRFDLTELFTLNQVHGSTVLLNSGGVADGIVLTKQGVAAAVFTADCFPVALFDLEKKISGIFHCGWKGTVAGIIQNGYQIMKDAGAENIDAVIMPGIEKCCFEVGNELFPIFKECGINLSDFKSDKAKADLKQGIINILKNLNIKNIEDLSICTLCNRDFFSFRRDKTEKRHLTYILNI